MKHLDTIIKILGGQDPLEAMEKAQAPDPPVTEQDQPGVQSNKPKRLETPLRVRVNKAFEKAGLDGNGRFPSNGRAINAIHGVMSDHGIEEDGIFSGDIWKQASGERTMDIAFSNADDPFSPTKISNSLLAVQWFELSPGKFEYVVRLT